MNKQSLSGFGLKGTGTVAVLFIMGIVLKFATTDDNLNILGIIAIVAAITIAIILGGIEIAERNKKLNEKF